MVIGALLDLDLGLLEAIDFLEGPIHRGGIRGSEILAVTHLGNLIEQLLIDREVPGRQIHQHGAPVLKLRGKRDRIITPCDDSVDLDAQRFRRGISC